MTVLSVPRRLEYRSSIKGLSQLMVAVELALRRGTVLSSTDALRVRQICQTADLTTAMTQLEHWHGSLEAQYHTLLKENALKSLSCFTEWMTPDEPPAMHHDWMAEKLEALMRRGIMRAAFSMHPGAAKTKFCSRYFPAWYLGHNNGHRFLQGGHSQNFCENEFGKYVREIIADPRYTEIFPHIRLNPRHQSAGNWKLAERVDNGTDWRPLKGGYVTKGVGQKIAGYRGNIGALDDIIGSKEEADSPTIRENTWKWFQADFRTRLLPGSPMYAVATRWHADDPIGRIEQMNKEGRGTPWEIFNLTAIVETEEEMAMDPLGRSIGEVVWPDYYDVATILDLKATLPSRDWWALYKGKPRSEEGTLIKKAWFGRYLRLPQWAPSELLHGTNEIQEGEGLPQDYVQLRRITISVDCANKADQRADYTVAGAWYEGVDGKHYLAEIIRKRMEFPEMVREVEALARRHGATCMLIEDRGAGTQFLQTRNGVNGIPLIPSKISNETKEFRMDGAAPTIEAGLVMLPLRAPWLDDYVDELLDFPNGSHDDCADMTSQYLNWVRKGRRFGTKKLKGGNMRRAA